MNVVRRESCHFFPISGFEEFTRLRPLAYLSMDIFLVCFAVDNPESYENLRSIWVPEVRQYCPDAALTVVGTKTDLRDQSDSPFITCQEVRTSCKFTLKRHLTRLASFTANYTVVT